MTQQKVQEVEVDVVVVGAGVGGIYSTYRLGKIGLNVQTIDMAGDVGGTWYWNRYPGAMSDTESYLYRYSWDKEDLQTYPWPQRYVYGPEILKYLQHITKKHDLRKYMKFNCEMKSANWDESTARWLVTTNTGTNYRARYLINSLGLLSKANYPQIPGLDSFQGSLIHTAKWDDSVPLEGKRVGIIGNGSTGVQVMTAIAPEVGKLLSFQRHPQYSVPSGQGPVTAKYRESVNKNYDQIWSDVWKSNVGFGVPESTRKTMEATPEERQAAFQEVWDAGNGFRFMFSAFGDLTTDEAANEEACKFIRSKIDEIVKDSRKAEILKPRDLYARRPLCDSGYYEIFNRDNVDVIDIKSNPIEHITPQGIKLIDGTTYDLDVLIFATGFEAIEGSYSRVSIVGRNGESMRDHWNEGLKAWGAVACAGFPNMFIVAGPQGAFANFPPVIEAEINLIVACIEHAEGISAPATSNVNVNVNGNGHSHSQTNGVSKEHQKPRIMEISKEAENAWSDLCHSLVKGSLFTRTESWIFSQNIPGKRPSVNFYFGGLAAYLKWTTEQVSGGFPGFL